MKKNIIFVFIFILAFLLLIGTDLRNYLGWIYIGTTEEPESFPKDETTHSISEVVCNNSSARWDYENKRVIISPTTELNGCNIIVTDKTDVVPPPEPDPLQECKDEKVKMSNYKTQIINAIKAAGGTVSSSNTVTFQYLGSVISSTLYKFPTSYTSEELSAIVQNSIEKSTEHFPLPFKTTPTCWISSASQSLPEMNCSWGIEQVNTQGYTWWVSNSNNWNGSCKIVVSCSQ